MAENGLEVDGSADKVGGLKSLMRGQRRLLIPEGGVEDGNWYSPSGLI
jgi:hypothetical protein